MSDAQPLILLVEDEFSAVIPLKRVLEDEGFRVLTARNGQEGLTLLREHHPDITLTDLKMPVMGGIEMISELRKDTWGKDAEVIILTNVSSPEVLEQALMHDTFYYFNKGDLSMESILEKINARLVARGKALPQKKQVNE